MYNQGLQRLKNAKKIGNVHPSFDHVIINKEKWEAEKFSAI